MAQEKPNRLAEWVVLLRHQIPVWRDRTARWFDAVRDEPILVWHTPAVRYGVYAVGGALGTWLLATAANMFLPAPPIQPGTTMLPAGKRSGGQVTSHS